MHPPHGAPPKMAIPGVKYLIAVASGKGGVGKSTVAANLALALKMHGQQVGLMDADIYGPSVPTMMGLGLVDQNTTPFPIEKFGLKLMSMGFLVDPNQAVIWRGPKVAQAVTAFLSQISWGSLDYLIIDLPPGTGDAQLTVTQQAPLTGAVIVTTPQDISLIDARKGLKMFNEVRVPVIGVVENMSYFVGDDGKRYEIFRSGGGEKLAREAEVPFLGAIPIDPRIAECGDMGEPIVSKYPDSIAGKAYSALAEAVVRELAQLKPTPELPEMNF
jgi:ATP-binding protein involved in chromosome partitioning